MKVGGIVCEYNPFHNGHAYHIEKTRESGATHIVCAMSGNFVQRGDCAIVDKWARAKSALLSGADLVVEIPTPWACSSAENFARGAIGILSALKIDMLSFGCETENAELLKKAAKAVDSPKIKTVLKKYISSGLTYPAALQKAVEEKFTSETAAVLASPNNTLAVEYIRQSEKLGACFEFLPVRRNVASHGDMKPADNQFSSASALRKMKNIPEIKNYIPQAMFAELKSSESEGLFPCLLENADRAILAFLRSMTVEKMKSCISDENGLAERLYSKSRNAETVFELIKSVKVKSLTEAAVRRAIIQCFLNIPKETASGYPPYIKILAAKKEGFEIIRERKPELPTVTKKNDADMLSEEAKTVYELECECTDKFSLFSKKIPGCSREQTSPIIVL